MCGVGVMEYEKLLMEVFNEVLEIGFVDLLGVNFVGVLGGRGGGGGGGGLILNLGFLCIV